MPDRALLDAALEGDEDAFGRLVVPYRAALHAHCYRMLGSVHDADDVLQDVLLRVWQALPRFEADRPLRPWLYTITTNACLNALASRQRRQLPMDVGPPTRSGDDDIDIRLPMSTWIEPYPDEQLGSGPEGDVASPEARYEQREAVELAFVAALQHLPGRQRAVLILRDVLGFSAREVAEMLGATVASVNSVLQRARTTLEERRPVRSQQATLRSLGDDGIREVVERFVDACEAGDVPAILALLADDVTFSMPPYPSWSRGRDAVARSWLIPSRPEPGLRYLATRANGQLALGAYQLDESRGAHLPIALDVLTLDVAGTIASVTAFRQPEVFPSFGLPEQLPS